MDRDTIIPLAVSVFLTILLLFLIELSCVPNRITDELAMARIARLAQVEVEDIKILDQSNNKLPFGNLLEATYEVEVQGKTGSATCTSGWMHTSPMVCRLYWGSVPQ